MANALVVIIMRRMSMMRRCDSDSLFVDYSTPSSLAGVTYVFGMQHPSTRRKWKLRLGQIFASHTAAICANYGPCRTVW